MQAHCGIHALALNPSGTRLVTGGANACDCAVFSLPSLTPLQLMVRRCQPASYPNPNLTRVRFSVTHTAQLRVPACEPASRNSPLRSCKSQ